MYTCYFSKELFEILFIIIINHIFIELIKLNLYFDLTLFYFLVIIIYFIKMYYHKNDLRRNNFQIYLQETVDYFIVPSMDCNINFS